MEQTPSSQNGTCTKRSLSQITFEIQESQAITGSA
jgi:hypothetical protein